MQSDNTLLELILHKQMSHFVLEREQVSPRLGKAVRVNDLFSRAMLQLNELKRAELYPTQFDESIISVNMESKSKLPQYLVEKSMDASE